MAENQDDSAKPAAPEPHDPTHPGHIDPDLPRLRTFADDLSDELKKKGSTLTTIVAAERERAAREIALNEEDAPQRESPWRSPILLIGTLVLVIIGVLALVGTYVYTALTEETPPDTAQSIIFPNKIVAFEVLEYQRFPDALAGEREIAALPLGEIERMDITLQNATTTLQTLLQRLEPPPALLREATSVMFGIHAFDRNQPFIIIEITQYDRAYGAMLEWEEEMGRSLGSFFKPRGGTVPPTTKFTDKVFQNIDARVSQDEWPILYAFPRRDVLVITTNQYTLAEILTRLNAQRTGSMVP